MPRNPLPLLWQNLTGKHIVAEFGGEHIITVRQHPVILAGPAFFVLGGLAVAAYATATGLPRNWLSLEFIWIAWTVLLVRLAWKVLEWLSRFFTLTASYKVYIYSGLVRRKVVVRSLTKVVRVTLYRSIPGRLVGYGELQFESISQDRPFWSLYYVPYSAQLFLEVYGLISSGDLYPGPVSGRRVTAEIES